MKIFLTFCLFILTSLVTWGQVDVNMEYNLVDHASGKKLSGVTVEVKDGGTVVASTITGSNGKAKLKVPSGKKYKVVYTKPGKVTRFLSLDVKGINAELIQGGNNVGTGEINVSLFDEIPGIDFSYVESNPFTEFYFDNNPKLAYDQIIAQKMSKKIDELLKKVAEQESKNEAMYQDAMSKGAEWYKKKNWKNALDKYEEAALLKPNEQEPKDKIKELDALIKKDESEGLLAKQKEEEYQKILATANALLNQKNYQGALDKYNEALKIKDEQYLKDQIKDVNKLIQNSKNEAENEANYKKALSNGDALATQNKFSEAKVQYQEALKLKAGDAVATKKIADLEAKIKEQSSLAEKKKKYEDAKNAADQLLASNKLVEAKSKYLEAQVFDNTQTYPATKIKEIDAKLANAAKDKEKTDKFNAAMKAGDDLFNANKLTEAKVKYQDAAKIDNSQSKPGENIQKIDKLLADQAEAQKNKEKAEKITALIKEGTTLYSKNDLENAKKKYQEVISLDVTNTEANQKIGEINAKLAEKASAAEKEQQFTKLKAKGFEQFSQNKLNDAKQTLLEAKALKADTEIDSKLKEIEKKIDEENAKLGVDQAYKKTIDEAKGLEGSNIDGAILKYKEAQKLKPSETLPASKIKELEDKKANNLAANANDAKYNEAIKKGDELVSQKKYTDAIKMYNQAGAIKPNEQEPVTKANKAKELSQNDETDAKKQYNKILEVGQKAIDEKNWDKAKEMFNRAISLDPADALPKNKLKEIDALIKDENDKLKNNQEKEAAYKKYISDAESAAKSKDYDNAISLFRQALSLKETEELPKRRIQELETLKSQNSNQAQVEKQYQDFMQKGNTAMNRKEYDNSLTSFKAALDLKPGDKVAKDKISEVEQILDNIAKSQNNSEFDDLLKEADVLFGKEDWIKAKNVYEKALNIKFDDYAKKQYDKCTSNAQKGNEFEKQYRKVIITADKNFDSKDYVRAKELYERAITLKSTDQYPKDKLAEIERILNPVVIQPAGPLANLGTPTTEDIEKVNAALVEAENKRKNAKNSRLKDKKERIQNNNIESSSAKNEEILGSAKTISKIEKKNSEKYESGDKKRQEIIEEVKGKQISVTDDQTQSQNLKYNESLNTTEQVSNVTSEVSQGYTSSDKKYEENTDLLKKIDKSSVDKNLLDSRADYNKRIVAQTELSAASKKIDEKVIDDFESRKVMEDQVKDAQNQVTKNDYLSNTKESENILALDVKFGAEDKIRSAKITEDTKVYGENNEEIKKIDQGIKVSNLDQHSKEVEKSLNSDDILARKEIQVEKVLAGQDGNRQNTVEELKSGNIKITESSREDYNKNMVKHLNSQEELNIKNKSVDGISEKEKLNAELIHNEMKIVDNKSTLALTQNVLSDDEQRQRTKDQTTNSTINISNENTNKAKKIDENISSVQSVNGSISSKNSEAQVTQKESLQNSQVLLSEISSKERKYDDKVANELGTLYPEGVSQEVFNKNDENNLLVAVITRRVVVKNGFGQIYIRTQSLNGITYSKNGEASTEYIWQLETQDAKLPKHY